MVAGGDGEGNEAVGLAGGDGDGTAVYLGRPAGEGETQVAGGERFGTGQTDGGGQWFVNGGEDGGAGGENGRVKAWRCLTGLVSRLQNRFLGPSLHGAREITAFRVNAHQSRVMLVGVNGVDGGEGRFLANGWVKHGQRFEDEEDEGDGKRDT